MSSEEVQIITREGEPEYAVLPYAEYLRLLDAAGQDEGIREAIDIRRRIDEGEETFPMALVERLLDGENPITVFREYRGLSKRELARRVGVSAQYVGKLEAGQGDMSLSVARRIAAALDLDLDDLFAERA
jgi:DNA-binding XRE family transcriptional regulator